MNIRNEIKAHIVQEGTTMSEVVRTLAGSMGGVPVFPIFRTSSSAAPCGTARRLSWPTYSATILSGGSEGGCIEHENQN